MKCKICEQEDKVSRLYVSGGCTVTLMSWETYYDENGYYHNHDPNITTTAFKCSNGHYYKIESKKGCQSCGTSGSEKIIYIQENPAVVTPTSIRSFVS